MFRLTLYIDPYVGIIQIRYDGRSIHTSSQPVLQAPLFSIAYIIAHIFLFVNSYTQRKNTRYPPDTKRQLHSLWT